MPDSPTAQNQKVEEINDLDATPAAEPKDSEEIPEPKVESTEETKVEGKETGEKSKKKSRKKGFDRRKEQLTSEITGLVKERDKVKSETQSLEEKLAALTAPVEPQVATKQPPTPQEEPIVKPGEEIDALELDKRIKAREQRILQQADAGAQLRTKQSEAVSRINNEASAAIKKYPELDPDSDSFNKDLSDSITEATEALVRANPYTASVKKFVDKQMKPFKGAVEKEVGEVTEKIAKQASETALRPTSVKGGEKKFEELTIEEMEKKLGTVY